MKRLRNRILARIRKSRTQPKPSAPVLRGHVDLVDRDGILHGWCTSQKSATATRLEVWIGDRKVGEGKADLPRPDVASQGLAELNCGFSIPLEFDKLPTQTLLAEATENIHLRISDEENRDLLGNREWSLRKEDRFALIQAAIRRPLENKALAIAFQRQLEFADPTLTTATAYQLLARCVTEAMSGHWDSSILEGFQEASVAAETFLQGAEHESCLRCVLILMALEHLSCCWDQEGLHVYPEGLCDAERAIRSQYLADQLNERCYFAAYGAEQDCWSSQLRPLFNVVIATLLLQRKTPDFSEVAPLVESLIRLVDLVFHDVPLAIALDSLIHPVAAAVSANTLRLQLRSGNALAVAIQLLQHRATGHSTDLPEIDQVLALVEVSKQSLITSEAAIARLIPLVPEWETRNQRSSDSRRQLDELGWHVNTLTSGLITEVIEHGLPDTLGLSVRERAIRTLSRISQAIWSPSTEDCTPVPTSGRAKLRWLLIGERSIHQCWLYRVEQKKHQLEAIGADVRCIDRAELDDWCFTQQVAWADAVVFCRTPATYGVVRALTFARHSGKKILADMDDLVFTPDFPGAYESYGGTISRALHQRLRLDVPLQLWPLANADSVILSTPALADACRDSLSTLSDPQVQVLPNLPLPELQTFARRTTGVSSRREPRLIVSSGTLAHKQIWLEELAPALAILMDRHSDLRVSLIGHLSLPTVLKPYKARISLIPYSDYKHYLQQVSKGTICLVALEKDITTDCKSAIKWMEASLLGLACVCSPVRAYTDAGSPEQHLLTASGKEEWLRQVERLLHDDELHSQLVSQAQKQVNQLFSEEIGEHFWEQWLRCGSDEESDSIARQRTRLLVINVFFAPQSFGGATRVAQDHVRDLIETHGDQYEVTVLCIDHDCWQNSNSNELPMDVWNWHGATIVRLAVPAKPWSWIRDGRVESFCWRWFEEQDFDEIHCHCCQVITASPLVVARKLGIPYRITLHDAWWISPELFLVSPGGHLIDPANPTGHIDGKPTPQQRAEAIERRADLSVILEGASQRFAVSEPFRQVYQQAGVPNVEVLENKATSMLLDGTTRERKREDPIRVCHIGGMSMHKGYHILRQAAHLLPADLHLEFTVIDHRLSSTDEQYQSSWNSYPVHFIAPVPMSLMASFYAGQDILAAPSIWPESFGLVTREAASAGLLVIASDIGALAEPITSAQIGERIPPGNARALSEALIRCIHFVERVKTKALA